MTTAERIQPHFTAPTNTGPERLYLRSYFPFSFLILGLSAGQEVKENLTGIVGGSIALPGGVTERVYLLYERTIIALVSGGEFIIEENFYETKLQWNRSSGLFKITNLQKNDSGIYTVQKGQVSSSYKLQIYDPAPTPDVKAVSLTSDLCLLTCSVDNPATLHWIRDKEIHNQSLSARSLPFIVHKEDRNSSYRCVAANPAENKTVDVNLTTSCWLSQEETLNDSKTRKRYWMLVLIPVTLVALVAFGVLVIRKKFMSQQPSASQTQGSVREEEVQYTPIHFKDKRQNQEENIPEPSGSSDNNLTTVYAKLEHPTTDQNLLTASG